jgi:hypothetical protein
VRRTGNQWCRFEFGVDLQTPAAKLASLDARLRHFVQSPAETVDIAHASCDSFELRPAGNQLVVVVRFQLRHNYQDALRRATSTNRFLGFVTRLMDELGIAYVPVPLRIFIEPS